LSIHQALHGAAAQDWSPFVLVAALLLIGQIANEDGLFAWAGHLVASLARNGAILLTGTALMVSVVTTVLNLDTSVAFLTPVVVHAARARTRDEAPLLYGCVLLSNAASLLLPGSNLTNLMVLGHLHMSGGAFAARMGLPWAAAVVSTTVVVGVWGRKGLRTATRPAPAPPRPNLGVGAAAVGTAVVLVLVLRSPALPVAAVATTAVSIRWLQRRIDGGEVWAAMGVPVLSGLLLLAVALGTVGRLWAGPAQLLGHLDRWATAPVAAAAAVVVNNLPAASLLAARVPPHPFALLIGLDLGPNLFITGSLSWIIWLRAARRAGARPSLLTGTRVGVMAALASLATAMAAAALTSLR